jgi:acid stress-induced BolA-like protein IbaG/YrbA
METEAVAALIRAGMPRADVTVSGDGRHFEATVINAEFEGKSLIEKHRMVLATVDAEIKSDALHALSIKAFTPAQWAALNTE